MDPLGRIEMMMMVMIVMIMRMMMVVMMMHWTVATLGRIAMQVEM